LKCLLTIVVGSRLGSKGKIAQALLENIPVHKIPFKAPGMGSERTHAKTQWPDEIYNSSFGSQDFG